MLHMAVTQKVAPQSEVPEVRVCKQRAPLLPHTFMLNAMTHPFSCTRAVLQGYLLHGGAALIPLKLAEKLGANAIKTAQPVYKIVVDRSAKTVAVLTQPPNANRYVGKAVIVAMAPHLAGRITYQPPMPPERDQLTQVRGGARRHRSQIHTCMLDAIC